MEWVEGKAYNKTMGKSNTEWLVRKGWAFRGGRKEGSREAEWKSGWYYLIEGKVEGCFKRERIINNKECCWEFKKMRTEDKLVIFSNVKVSVFPTFLNTYSCLFDKEVWSAEVEVHDIRLGWSHLLANLCRSLYHSCAVYLLMHQAYIPGNRHFFSIIRNSKSKNLDGFLFKKVLWVFYQMYTFYHHIHLEKKFLNQNFAKIQGGVILVAG